MPCLFRPFWFIFHAAFSGLLATATFAQPTADQLAKLDSTLTAAHRQQQFSGVFLVAQHGNVLYSRALGTTDAGGQTPLTLRSAFNLASVSKTFTSMLALMLKEEGKLQLDAPVRQYLPAFPYPAITVRHLLTHTHGLPEYFDFVRKHGDTLQILNNQRVLDLLAKHQPAPGFPAGEQFTYCNTGYILLALVVEKASGQPLGRLLRQRIIRPLRLRDTYLYTLTMPKSPKNRVYGMQYVAGRWQPNDLIQMDGVFGDGNVYASVLDLLKWDRALYTEQLVSRATLTEAFTPVKVRNVPPFQYGLGWVINEEGKRVSHSGSWVGFKNNFVRDLAHDVTLIGLTNATTTAAPRAAFTVLLSPKPVQ